MKKNQEVKNHHQRLMYLGQCKRLGTAPSPFWRELSARDIRQDIERKFNAAGYLRKHWALMGMGLRFRDRLKVIRAAK